MIFNSATLQHCFNQSRQILDNIDVCNDLISQDINNLESYLNSLSLSETLHYEFSRHYHPILEEEFIAWDHERRRLIYIKNTYSDRQGYGYESDLKDDKITYERPLIEVPFDIRKNIYEIDALSNFLWAIAKKYEVKNLDIPIRF